VLKCCVCIINKYLLMKTRKMKGKQKAAFWYVARPFSKLLFEEFLLHLRHTQSYFHDQNEQSVCNDLFVHQGNVKCTQCDSVQINSADPNHSHVVLHQTMYCCNNQLHDKATKCSVHITGVEQCCTGSMECAWNPQNISTSPNFQTQ
jgi:hypothetical protein